jgi:hypothetical protein
MQKQTNIALTHAATFCELWEIAPWRTRSMTIENYMAFLERVPILRRLGAGALRILGANAVDSAAVAASINAATKGLYWNRHAPKRR